MSNKDGLTAEKNMKKGTKNKGLVILLSSAVLGSLVLGGTYLASQNSEVVDKAVEYKSNSNIKNGFNKAFEKQVDKEKYKSIASEVVDYSQEPYNDGYAPKDDFLQYLNLEKYKEVMQESTKKPVLIYVGRPNCPYCHQFRQVLDPILSGLNMPIYAIDSIYAKYETALYDEIINLEVQSVPTILVIKDEKVVDTSETLENGMYESAELSSWIMSSLSQNK